MTLQSKSRRQHDEQHHHEKVEMYENSLGSFVMRVDCYEIWMPPQTDPTLSSCFSTMAVSKVHLVWFDWQDTVIIPVLTSALIALVNFLYNLLMWALCTYAGGMQDYLVKISALYFLHVMCSWWGVMWKGRLLKIFQVILSSLLIKAKPRCHNWFKWKSCSVTQSFELA